MTRHVSLPPNIQADINADLERRTARALAMRGQPALDGAPISTSVGMSKPNQWRAEWSRSNALQEQFASADSYAEHKAAEARARAVTPPTSTGTPAAPARASAAAPITAAIAPGVPTMMSDEQRRAAIDALSLPGLETLIAECKSDVSCMPSQAALRIMAAERVRRGSSDSLSSPPATSRSTAADLRALPAKARAEWQASAELQAEFRTVGAYQAYRHGVATGRIRVAGGRASGAQAARSFIASPARQPVKG